MAELKTRWPFGGFFFPLMEVQKECEQERVVPALTEEERNRRIQEILAYMHAPRKKKKDDGEALDPIVPEKPPEEAQVPTDADAPGKQYISDLVGEDFKRWNGMVVLDAGTNSGKTYFVLTRLLPWAHEKNKRILFLCNRDALREQVQQDVCRLGRVEYTDPEGDYVDGKMVAVTEIRNRYEHTIQVETYQWLETFCLKNPDGAKVYLRMFDYIVADEYHYMVTDASFNDHVELSYEAIKELTTIRTCIFMSATARLFSTTGWSTK